MTAPSSQPPSSPRIRVSTINDVEQAPTLKVHVQPLNGQTTVEVFPDSGFVGFDEDKRTRLATFFSKKEAVALQNCRVKMSRDSTEFEVVVNGCTELLQPPKKKFDVGNIDLATIDNKNITLDPLDELSDYQRVTFAVKGIQVDEPVHVVGGKRNQEILLSDSSGKSKFTCHYSSAQCNVYDLPSEI